MPDTCSPLLPEDRELILTGDAVIEGGRELTGQEITHLADLIEQARLETLWRELNRDFPLGSWVRGARSRRPEPDQIIGYERANRRGADHMIRTRSSSGVELRLPQSEVEVVSAPRGER